MEFKFKRKKKGKTFFLFYKTCKQNNSYIFFKSLLHYLEIKLLNNGRQTIIK